MIRPKIILLIAIFAYLRILAQPSHILFDKNSDLITATGKLTLDSIIVDIEKGNGAEAIGLSGHTDMDAGDEYNKKLSLRRAIAVRDYLTTKGLKNQIHIDSKGEQMQLNSNETEEDKAQNRRVEILRYYSKNNFAFNSFNKDVQTYSINSEKDTLLACKWGATIKLDKGIFQTTGSSSPVIVKIREYYTKKDFVLSNLTTRDLSNNQLESRGMINVEVFQDEKPVDLKPGKSIGILFKDRKKNDNTEIFNGITHNEEVVWDNASGSGTTKISGTSKTMSAMVVVESSEWKYEVINGEKFKVTKRTKNGKTTYDTISAESENLTKDLVLNSKKLGWINCDRFYKDNSPKIDITVKYTGAFAPNMVAVFEDINSVLPYSYREDNKLIFKNIPAGKDIVFIGLFKSKGKDKIWFAQKKTKSREGLVESVTFDELNSDDVQQKVSAL
jgi:hypothetical protein